MLEAADAIRAESVKELEPKMANSVGWDSG